MDIRSLFNIPREAPIPLLPIYNSPGQHSHLSSPSASAQDPYQTAPQSPDLYAKHASPRQFVADDLPDTMTAPNQVAQIPQSDAQTAINRQQAYLESYFQTLLDAQSEGLLAGLGTASPHDDRSSTGRSASRSSTSTARPSSTSRSNVAWGSPEDARVIPVRQPKPRRIGLRSARKGLSKTMGELAVLKTEEAQTLELEVEEREDIITEASRIVEKDAGLREHIRKIETEPASDRARGLKEEEKTLDTEIKGTELRLYEMKARQRVLKSEVQRLENGVQAKLSSYRNALGLAEKEAQNFVAKPLLEGERSGRVKTGLWALPKERRTLEMVREQYGDESELMKRQIKQVEKERQALEEGREVWNEVVNVVMGVEETLRAEMKKMRKTTSEVGMKKVLGRLSSAKHIVEEKLALVEDKGWNLLMVAIGAEVEALGEGYEVLKAALQEATGETHTEDLLRDPSKDARDRRKDFGGANGPEESKGGQEQNGADALLGRAEEEDDEPGPELLIQEEETS